MPIIQTTQNLNIEKPEANHAAWERSYWRLATLVDLWFTQIARGHYVVSGGNLTLDGTDIDLDATSVQFVGTAAPYAVGPATPISPLVSGNTYIVYVDNAGALQVSTLTPSLLWSGALPSDFVLLGAAYEVEGVWTIHNRPLVTGRGKVGGVASLDGDGNVPIAQLPLFWTHLSLVGSAFSMPANIGTCSLARLNATDIAFVDSVNDELRCYGFNGANWALIGSAFAIGSVGTSPTICDMNATDIAFYDITGAQLRCYRFNGAVWSLVGSGLAIAGGSSGCLAKLSATDVVLAVALGGNVELRRYHFDGAVWSQVGNILVVAGAAVPSIAVMNSRDVAYIDVTSQSLRLYRINGPNWSQVGSGLAVPSSALRVGMFALNQWDVGLALPDSSGLLKIFRFNGATWVQVGPNFTVVLNPLGIGIAAMNGNEFAYCESNGDQLQLFRLAYSIGAPYLT